MAEEIKNILEPGGTEIDTAAGGARRYRKPLKSFRWCDIKPLLSDSFSAVLAAFSERQRVHICPGWSLERSWSLPEVVRLDGQRRASLSFPTGLVTAVHEALTQALSAMGQQPLMTSPGTVPVPTT